MNPKGSCSRLGQGKSGSIACAKLTQNGFCDEVARHALPIINTVACQLGGIGRAQPELREQGKFRLRYSANCSYIAHMLFVISVVIDEKCGYGCIMVR